MKKEKRKKKEKTKDSLLNFFASSMIVRWGILAGVMGIFVVILYPNLFVQKHFYQVGDVAETDIKASRDFFVEDKKATESKRLEAAENVLTIYDYDATLISRLTQQIEQSFADMRAVFEPERKALKNEAKEPENKPEKTLPSSTDAPSETGGKSPHDRIWQMKEDFEKKLGIPVSEESFKILEKEKFSKETPDIIIQIVSQILENGVVANKEILLREGDKGIVLRTLETKTENVVQNLKKFYGPDQYKEMVRIIGKPLVKDISPNLVPIIVDFSQRIIQPNITLNKSETEKRKEIAAANVEPIPYKIKEGEMLLREGERVGKEHLVKLKMLDTQQKQEKIHIKTIGAAAIILSMILITYFLHIRHVKRADGNHNKDVLFMASILVLFSLLPKISAFLLDTFPQDTFLAMPASAISFGVPIASGAMIVCLFMGLDAAIPIAVVIAVCTAVIFQNKFEMFVYFLLNSMMAAYWMQNCKERKVFIKAGAKLGVLNVVLATVISIYTGNAVSVELLWVWAFAFMGGIAAGIVTSGLAPLLEIAFGYTTDITLLELANLEQPILRRLMLEAPGTYHHSVIVGSMVEAAASEIGANPLLAKVCGYYHDIGKIKKPLYFIENQTDGKNRHDKLAPSMSSLILISHVKEGVEIAKKYKLGKIITDAVRQHHGTSLISFFYEKAKQLKGEDAVKIEDFCYPGPRPQTKEAGLVMLADVVEAASRTLENPTPSRIQGHVQRLISKIFSDGQLDYCELTLKDLHNIAKSFNKILNGIHHHRIEYPENGKDKKETKEVKEKNENPDQQPAKPPKDSSGKNTESSANSLKRFGES